MMTRLLTLLTICLTLWACSQAESASSAVDDIAAALNSGNTGRAQKEADRLLADSVVFNALSASQLCRLSQLLVSINPGSEAEGNDASAARCLNRARDLQPDSVNAFLASLSGEDAGRLMVLDRVGSYLGMPRDSLVSAEDLPSDSITSHTHE